MSAVLAALLMQCERALCSPSKRLVSRLVRLATPDGGNRLIALLDTIIRVWGRLRRPGSERWELTQRTEEFWELGRGGAQVYQLLIRTFVPQLPDRKACTRSQLF